MLKFFAVLLFCSSTAVAQFTYSVDQNVIVHDKDGKVLNLAWAGGLNSAQYNTMDLNLDGKDDLVLFDRMAKKVVTFLQADDTWQYAPEYEYFFPTTITNWLLLRDYNCDGKKDIFTGDVLGIKVFLNTQTGSTPSWKQIQFYSSPGSKSDVILTKGFTGKINIQLQFDDLPFINDVDGDGDVDIFNMRFVGGSVEFHKNMSKEKYGSCDSLEFERVTQSWGDVRDCYCGTFAFNDRDCSTSGRLNHAVGKSLLLLDADNDQRLDLLFSEAECSSVFQLKNEGTLTEPVINRSSEFPLEDPAQLISYPAGYFEDVDFDQKKDLVFSSNDFSKDDLESNLAQSNIFYKNSGTNTAPVFTRVQNNFLQDKMIDVGDNSVPAFADYDGDGDYDLFVSSNSSEQLTSRILLFENSGTEKSPFFKLLTDDYLEFIDNTFYNVKIQFSDINGDNALDLVFTASRMEKSGTKLFYILNMGALNLSLDKNAVVETDFSINYDENIYVTDINQDGNVDLLAARGSGKLELWKNTGTTSNLKFSLIDNDFMKVNVTGYNQIVSPFVTDLDNDGTRDLIYSDGTGHINVISDFQSKSDATTAVQNVILNPLSETSVTQNLGIKSFLTAANVFNTTRPSIILGSVLGGLLFLKSANDEPLPDAPSVDVFPNPLESSKVLNIKSDRSASVQIISSLGKEFHGFLVQAHQTFQYKFPQLQAGVYFLKFNFQNRSLVKRVVLL